jgi:hypothetical protein
MIGTLVAEFESDVGASGIRSRADARGDGERGGREALLASHVPGMRKTDKSQVAVKTIPWPIKNEN